MIGPGVSALYLLATWPGQHRPVMLAVAAAMIGVAAVTWWRSPSIARSGARPGIQVVVMLVNIAGSAVLTLLDGGVGSPLGALLPFSLLFYAVMMPPRVFLAAAGLTAVAYWTVVVLGEPTPPGYAAVYTLGMGGVSYVCLRHATALVAMRRRLAHLSRVDPLTRCLNRRGFDERLEQSLGEAVRTGRPITLVVIDLDRFKEVNDTYGHQAGDDLLGWTARAMSSELRGYDAVGRLGGDEFAVLLNDVGPDEAQELVTRLRTALDGVAPASFGYACYPSQAGSLQRLRQLADERAYAEKVTRSHRLPTAAGVSRAGAQGAAQPATKVPRGQRRGRSIVNLGLLTASDSAVGAVYAALFAHAEPDRMLMGVLCGLGVAYGLAVIAAADRLRGSRVVGQFMLGNAVMLFCFAVGVTVLDGGVGSALGLALLAPMPLIALAAPMRVAVPILAVVAGAYLSVAAVLGAPSGWFVVMHLAGILTVCAACAVQGRAAARQRKLLTRLSNVDPLTECLNRRGFEERFAAELGRAGRTAGVLSLLIFDLDGFKQLNDSAGHVAGDDLLRWVADTLRANLRPQEVLGRLGGDEFVVVVRSASADDAGPTAERLRAALAARTPASVGVAVFDRDGTDFQTLYAHADAELYAEKSARKGTPGRVRRPRAADGVTA
jgi:diguanylate cyclase (GGDEF)-like protein